MATNSKKAKEGAAKLSTKKPAAKKPAKKPAAKKQEDKPAQPEAKETIQAPYKFTADEIAHMNIELRTRLDDIETLEEQKKQSSQDFALRIKTREIEAKQLRNKLSAGEETRPLEARVVFHPARSMKAYHHPQTGDFIREEPMQPADWQLPLFKQDEKKPDTTASTTGALAPTGAPAPKAPAKPKPEAPQPNVAPVGFTLVTAGNSKVGDKKFVQGQGWTELSPSDDDTPAASFLGLARPNADDTAGKTNIGDKLDAATVLKEAKPLIIDLTLDWQPDALLKEFNKTAKAAKWTQVQISFIRDALKAAKDVEAMMDILRPHSNRPETAPEGDPTAL